MRQAVAAHWEARWPSLHFLLAELWFVEQAALSCGFVQGGEQLTTYLAALLFFYFGARLLMDAFSSSEYVPRCALAVADLPRTGIRRTLTHIPLWHASEPNSELEEVEAELSGKGDRVDGSKANASKVRDESHAVGLAAVACYLRPMAISAWLWQIAVAVKKQLQVVLSPIVWKAFTMTFLAEWGDRSQIATITLAAEGDMLGVTLGK
eukprot:scaffold269_cov404-Prasinococcus_capsulatus_cf.AAC.47